MCDSQSTLGVYGFLRDQGAILAGLMAIGAAYLAYRPVKQQNEWLKRDSRRKMASEGLVSVRLLEGVLAKIEEDITTLRNALAQPPYSADHATIPANWRKLISKPPLATVWDTLGRCSRETVTKYLALDAKLDRFAVTDIFSAGYMRGQLAIFTELVNFLRAELEGEGKRYYKVVDQISEQ
jgi:hypothetical protein